MSAAPLSPEPAGSGESDVFEIDLPITIFVLSDDDFPESEDEEQAIFSSDDILKSEEEEVAISNDGDLKKIKEEKQVPSSGDDLKSQVQPSLNEEVVLKCPEKEQVTLSVFEKLNSPQVFLSDQYALGSSKPSQNYLSCPSAPRMDPGEVSGCVESKECKDDTDCQKVPVPLSCGDNKDRDGLTIETTRQLIPGAIFKDGKECETSAISSSDSTQDCQPALHCKEAERCVETEGTVPLETAKNKTDDRTRMRNGSTDETLNCGMDSKFEDLNAVKEIEQVQSIFFTCINGDFSTAGELLEDVGDLAMTTCDNPGLNISEEFIHQSVIHSPREMDKQEDCDVSHVIIKHPNAKHQEETFLRGNEHNSEALSMGSCSTCKHEKTLNVKCRFCSSVCTSKNILKKHVYSAHQDKKIHKCCFCQRSFFFSVNVKRHLKFHKKMTRLKNTRKGRSMNTEKARKENPAKTQSANKKKESKYEKFFIRIERDCKTADAPVVFSCKICLFASPDPKLFVYHMKGHKGRQPYQCPQCDYSCISLSYMLNHMYWHAGYRLYKCRFCTFFSLYFASMVKHSYIHTGAKPYSCEFCQSSFTSTSGLKRHTNIHAGKELCQGKQHLGLPVEGKRTKSPPKSYTCDQCNLVFYSKGLLYFHEKFHTQVKACDERFVNDYANESNEYSKSKACKDDNDYQKDWVSSGSDNKWDDHLLNETHEMLASGAELEQENEFERDMNICCSKKTCQSSEGTNNLPVVRTGSETLFSIYKSDQCDLVFCKEKHLCFQKVTHSQVQECNEIVTNAPKAEENAKCIDVQPPIGTSHKLFKCQQCDYSTYIFSNLKLHFRIHTGEKPFECKECNKMFRTSSHLRRHSLMHIKKGQECDHCHYLGSTSDDLKLHCEIHKGTCPKREDLISSKDVKCVRSIFSSEDLQKQMDVHEGKENEHVLPSRSLSQLYKCEQCNYITYVLSNLKLHTRIHTGEKPHSCDTCQKKFRTSGHLNRHKLVHLKMECLKCRNCDYSTDKWQSLKWHLASHSDEKNLAGSKVQEQSLLPVKIYKCEECGYATAHSGNFKQHLRIHTGEKPYKCDQCTLAFRTSSHLKRHLLTHLKLRCNECEFSTIDRCALEKHVKTHKDKKMYKCQKCNVILSTIHLLEKHKKQHL
ncbi:zinc finger protein 808-like [Chrysemys picta bellii]|uniref:zinc finger protein 808-like n=1 Tax=Chrysemys picta bellii TaxID=8478 RepID=UPI0032B0F67D